MEKKVRKSGDSNDSDESKMLWMSSEDATQRTTTAAMCEMPSHPIFRARAHVLLASRSHSECPPLSSGRVHGTRVRDKYDTAVTKAREL